MTGTASITALADHRLTIRSLLRRLRIFAFIPGLSVFCGCNAISKNGPNVETLTVPLATHSADTLAPGILHRAVPLSQDSGVDVIDISLAETRIRPRIETRGIAIVSGAVAADARTSEDWLSSGDNIVCVNGGYFGNSYSDDKKEILGLLVQRGRVRRSEPLIRVGHTMPRYVARAAFGIDRSGVPSIRWASTKTIGGVLHVLSYETPNPTVDTVPEVWNVTEAIGCGPLLVTQGRIKITDKEERLVNDWSRPRTFLALDRRNGRARHLIICVGSSMTYRDAAVFTENYFEHYDKTHVESAMCVDGGSSSQISYRSDGLVLSPMNPGVGVPDSIVLGKSQR